jgi:beta-glucanase (GH16 family)
MIEAQIDLPTGQGQASQSFQIAPFDDGYNFFSRPPATTIYNTTNTVPNTYKGGIWQQALSSLTYLRSKDYVGTQGQFGVYAFEYNPSRGSDGYITWAANGMKTWTVTTASVAPNPISQVSQRIIPEEPMVRLLLLTFFRYMRNSDTLVVYDCEFRHVTWFPRTGLREAQVPCADEG